MSENYWDKVARETATGLLLIFEEWHGAQVALSRSDLCKQLGCTDSVLKTAIGQLRQQGHLVIAVKGGGYRLALSVDEVEEYVQSLRVQANALDETIAALATSLAVAAMSQQMRFSL